MRPEFWIAALLVAATCAAFSPLAGADFILLDDLDYVVQNERVRAGLTLEGTRWAFTTTELANWHPLTWLSYMLDVELFGVDPGVHHLVNLGLHVANTLVLFLLLAAATGAPGRSGVVAALFALHPIHVESVAWISERKDVLSTLLGLLATGAYGRWTRAGRARDYALAGLLLALGLMTKPMLVTLPFAWLLLDFWPLGRTQLAPAARANTASEPAPLLRLAVEKLPFLALVAASSWVTLLAQGDGGAIVELPFAWRAGSALVAWVTYLGKMLWPAELLVVYPHPGRFPLATVALSATLLVALTAGALSQLRRRPWLAFGWLFYLGTLVPVIGLVQVGVQWIADRYSYVPLIGIFIATVWGVNELRERLRVAAPAAVLPALVLLAALGATTFVQTELWRATEPLFAHALERTRGNSVAHRAMADLRVQQGRIPEALVHYETLVAIVPDDGPAHYNLARLLVRQERDAEARKQLDRARELLPDHAKTRFYLGLLAERAGDYGAAAAHYQDGLALEPGDAQARARLAYSLERVRAGGRLPSP